MADLVLRNLDDTLKDKLRRSAALHGRSMNAELLDIVREALSPARRTRSADVKALAADIRRLSAGRDQTPAEELMRESRDER